MGERCICLNDERVAGTPCFISSNSKSLYQDRMSQCAFPGKMYIFSFHRPDVFCLSLHKEIEEDWRLLNKDKGDTGGKANIARGFFSKKVELKATSPVSGCRVENGSGFSIPVRNKHCLLL